MSTDSAGKDGQVSGHTISVGELMDALAAAPPACLVNLRGCWGPFPVDDVFVGVSRRTQKRSLILGTRSLPDMRRKTVTVKRLTQILGEIDRRLPVDLSGPYDSGPAEAAGYSDYLAGFYIDAPSITLHLDPGRRIDLANMN